MKKLLTILLFFSCNTTTLEPKEIPYVDSSGYIIINGHQYWEAKIKK